MGTGGKRCRCGERDCTCRRRDGFAAHPPHALLVAPLHVCPVRTARQGDPPASALEPPVDRGARQLRRTAAVHVPDGVLALLLRFLLERVDATAGEYKSVALVSRQFRCAMQMPFRLRTLRATNTALSSGWSRTSPGWKLMESTSMYWRRSATLCDAREGTQYKSMARPGNLAVHTALHYALLRCDSSGVAVVAAALDAAAGGCSCDDCKLQQARFGLPARGDAQLPSRSGIKRWTLLPLHFISLNLRWDILLRDDAYNNTTCGETPPQGLTLALQRRVALVRAALRRGHQVDVRLRRVPSNALTTVTGRLRHRPSRANVQQHAARPDDYDVSVRHCPVRPTPASCPRRPARARPKRPRGGTGALGGVRTAAGADATDARQAELSCGVHLDSFRDPPKCIDPIKDARVLTALLDVQLVHYPAAGVSWATQTPASEAGGVASSTVSYRRSCTCPSMAACAVTCGRQTRFESRATDPRDIRNMSRVHGCFAVVLTFEEQLWDVAGGELPCTRGPRSPSAYLREHSYFAEKTLCLTSATCQPHHIAHNAATGLQNQMCVDFLVHTAIPNSRQQKGALDRVDRARFTEHGHRLEARAACGLYSVLVPICGGGGITPARFDVPSVRLPHGSDLVVPVDIEEYPAGHYPYLLSADSLLPFNYISGDRLHEVPYGRTYGPEWDGVIQLDDNLSPDERVFPTWIGGHPHTAAEVAEHEVMRRELTRARRELRKPLDWS